VQLAAGRHELHAVADADLRARVGREEHLVVHLDGGLAAERHHGGAHHLFHPPQHGDLVVARHEARAVEVALAHDGEGDLLGADHRGAAQVPIVVEDGVVALADRPRAAGQHQPLVGVDAGRVAHHVGVQPEDVGPEEGVGQVLPSQVPERVAAADHVHAPFGNGVLLGGERARGGQGGGYGECSSLHMTSHGA
jgi:hypothetical protein